MPRFRVPFHDGEIKRYCVHVTCTSHPEIGEMDTSVFATSEKDACDAAIEKMREKWHRTQGKLTRWIAGEVFEE